MHVVKTESAHPLPPPPTLSPPSPASPQKQDCTALTCCGQVSVCPGGLASGYTYFIPQEEHLESHVVTRGYLEGRMVVGMAGRYTHCFLALSLLLPACHKGQLPAVYGSVGSDRKRGSKHQEMGLLPTRYMLFCNSSGAMACLRAASVY